MDALRAALRHPGRLALVGLAGLFALFVAVSWGQWPLVTADSARELYVPFQIRHGALIYRDFVYLYGPLAPYIDAGLLALFGEHLEVLYAANLALLALTIGLLYGLARQLLAPLASAAVVFLFFTHFALGRDIWGYAWPYAAAATFGVALGLGLLLALARHARSGRAGDLLAAGACLGLSLVDKLEYGFAAAGLALFYGLVRAWTAGSLARWAREAALVALPALAIVGLAAWAILRQMPASTVLESVWPLALMKLWNSQGAWHGTPATWLNNAKWLAFDGGVLALAIAHPAIARALARATLAQRLALVGALAAAGALAVHDRHGLGFFLANAPLYWPGPSFALLIGLGARVAWRVGRERERERPPDAAGVLWAMIALYGCLVAFRTLLTGYNDYTRYQAPVALVAWVALATVWLPGWARSRGWLADADGPRVRVALALVALGLGGAQYTGHLRDYMAPHQAVSGPHGTLYAQTAYAEPFNQAVRYLRSHTHPGEPLVVAPMEASIFTFTGCENALREDQLFYGYLTTIEEQEQVIRRMQARGVHYLVLSNYGWGNKRFGEDYMQALARWIDRRCELVADFPAGLAPAERARAPYRLRIYTTPMATPVHFDGNRR